MNEECEEMELIEPTAGFPDGFEAGCFHGKRLHHFGRVFHVCFSGVFGEM